MQINVKIEGLEKLAAKSKAATRIVEQEAQKGLFASAKQVEATAKKSIQNGQKSGHVYRRGKVTHRASAPGEAPASDTGRLVNSISSYLDTTSLTGFVTAGRGTVKYAAMLEFGTQKIAPRPFMFPALESNRKYIADRMEKALDNAIKRVGK